MSKKSLLDLINEKIEEARARAASGETPKPKPATRAAINKANAAKSTGPKSQEGKAAASQNALKHGFFANVARLDPTDAPTFQSLLTDFRQGMHPDGPIEDLCCRELAMLQARLQRLESIEFALIMGNVEGPPATTNPALSPGRQSGDSPALYLHDEFNEGQHLDYYIDSRDLAQAFSVTGDALDRVHKIETHLRRAYNRTFDRLQRIQRDRLKAPREFPPHPDRFPVGKQERGNLQERTDSYLSHEKQTPSPISLPPQSTPETEPASTLPESPCLSPENMPPEHVS